VVKLCNFNYCVVSALLISMSLYEDDDVAVKPEATAAAGWSKGLTKGLTWIQQQQHQQQQKAAAAVAAAAAAAGATGASSMSTPTSQLVGRPKPKPAMPQPQSASTPSPLPPVIKLGSGSGSGGGSRNKSTPRVFSFGSRGDENLLPLGDPDWTPVNEYDPLWPNDYHKVAKEIKEVKRQASEEEDGKRRRFSEQRRRDRGDSGRRSDDEEDDDRGRGSSKFSRSSSGAAIAPPPSLTGAAIAPPSSLTESSVGESTSGSSSPVSMVHRLASTPATTSLAGMGVAAKIMAKYGYKQGQGLGRDEQGMSTALSVEKTSKRGGRILHEKDLLPPPPLFHMAAEGQSEAEIATTPPYEGGAQPDGEAQQKPSITDLMRNPSKVVLCKNMVGPGEVDDELEPEVKEECAGKYGDVDKVVIFELQNVSPEEAVRIFIEFKRVESAIKGESYFANQSIINHSDCFSRG